MKKWKCSVCGYIHEGDSPPEKCPQCGAPKEKFVLIEDGATDDKNLVSEMVSDDVLETDILVIGTGAAAFSAAITARKNGADVIMLEKGSMVGGTTIRSGGGFWTPNNKFQRQTGIEDNKADALKYMARYSYPQLYNPNAERYGLPVNEFELIEAMYDNASKAIEFLDDCGALKSIEQINWLGKMQVDYQDHLPENKGIRGRCLFATNPEGKQGYGYDLITQVETWANKNGIKILLNHEAVKILKHDARVVGLEVKVNGDKLQTFRVRKAVIFGSGGYSHNPELMLHFQRGPHFGGCSAPTNTGDFIKLAGEIGAKLGNMAGAFRSESVVEGVIAEPGGSNNAFFIVGDSIITVNRYGKRVMNEKRNYTDRSMVHFEWDPDNAEWKNMLLFLVYDQRTASLWNDFPPFMIQGDKVPSYMIKADTLEDLTEQISKRLDKISDHTGGFTLSDEFNENLKSTVQRFNGFAKSGKDEDFQRGEFDYDKEWTTYPPSTPGHEWPPKDSKNYTMYPISDEGPYYSIILGAGTLDTNGGPVINNKSQILGWDDKPIPGLYGAGNCIASPAANAYWGGGSTIGPALTFGYLAGLNAVK